MDQVAKIITAIIGLILVIGGIVSFLWLIIGTPLGIIFLILYFTAKEKDAKKKYKKWFFLSFPSGILAMIVVFVLWFIYILISTSLGISTTFTQPLPMLTP